MRYKNLLLAVILVLLTSCNQPPPAPRFCPIAIHANDCVKDWFKEPGLPAPQCVKDYLKNIGDEQADIDKYCTR